MNRQKTLHGFSKPGLLRRGRSLKQCHCGAWFSLPTCHAERHKSCTAECLAKLRLQEKQKAIAERSRKCEECGDPFIARPWQIRNGIGRFCSNPCAARAAHKTDAFKAARYVGAQTKRRRLMLGELTPQVQPRGEESPYWKGGAEATRQRMKERGAIKAYRSANPDKVREWSQRRRGRKTGRLPRGTVKSLLEKQRCRCAICTKSIKDGYHVDHILPLALNGKHEPLNIQLLCPACNMRKNAKHPIRYAQELGLLL